MKPRIALTLGDVAGIGPEVVVRALADPAIWEWCEPVVVGHPEVLKRAITLLGLPLTVDIRDDLASTPGLGENAPGTTVSCFNPAQRPEEEGARDVLPGQLDWRAGRAAYDALIFAADAAIARSVDAIVTAPLNKAALHLAGLNYPGHTEILAERCGVRDFGMMLYLPRAGAVQSPHGLGVVHVTLHTSIRSVPELITTDGVFEKINLIAGFMEEMGAARSRVAVCALNPHAGEAGLFGDEESRLIEPAVARAQAAGISVTGPLPADTLLRRAVGGEFDAVVAMYHDQGHIAFKLIGFDSAVNITLGLPIIRTSPSHGTAFDIAWQGKAEATGFLHAVRVAAARVRACRNSTNPQQTNN